MSLHQHTNLNTYSHPKLPSQELRKSYETEPTVSAFAITKLKDLLKKAGRKDLLVTPQPNNKQPKMYKDSSHLEKGEKIKSSS